MIITVSKGDLFEGKTKAIVNPVNCVGVMGKGLALQFKQRFPLYFKHYKLLCDRGLMVPGQVDFYQSNDKYIISFPTKDHWKNKSKLSYVKEGIVSLYQGLNKYLVSSVNIPALGCGLGGLNWKDVKEIIVNEAKKHDTIITTLFEHR